MRSGFTLIELLVVVLIIGILAAVALPQYTRTVEKSRYAQLQIRGDAIKKAADAYYLENGVYPNDVTELVIDITDGGTIGTTQGTAAVHIGVIYPNGDYCFTNQTVSACFKVKNGKEFVSYLRWYDNILDATLKGKTHCCSYDSTTSEDDNLCISVGGKSPFTLNTGVSCYVL